MAELKTKPNKASVSAFLNSVENETRRKDAKATLKLMKEVSGERPKMWGGSIIGFGLYKYKYPTGREGEWFVTGFSPRKQSLTLYMMSGFGKMDDLLGKLGKHKTGKGCLYINKLEDVDLKVLERLIKESIKFVKKTYPD